MAVSTASRGIFTVPLATAGSAGRIRSTLEDRVLGVWEDLSARGRAECPVCSGELRPSGCCSCGSRLC